MPLPANIRFIAEFQDTRGFRSLTEINTFSPDINNGGADSGIVLMTIGSLALLASGTSGIFAALAAMSNAKMVRQSVVIDLNYAEEPTSETGIYQLVTQKAHLQFADGRGGFNFLSIPAPVDGLFLTSADNNKIVVDPTSSLLNDGSGHGLQPAMAANTAQAAVSAQNVGPFLTPRGGTWGAQFFGGQLREAKPRRRRVLQGQ